MDYRSIFKVLSLIGVTLGLFFGFDLMIGWLYDESIFALFLFDALFIGMNLTIFLFLCSCGNCMQ